MKPQEALRFWDISKSAAVKFLPVGIFNDTYEVQYKFSSRSRRHARRKEDFFILQKLHSLISGSGPTANYLSITDFLRKNGFPAQSVIPAANGKFLVRDRERSWRLMKGVEGKIYTATRSPKIVRGAGRCLGKTHKLLTDFRGGLHPTLPMFQYEKVLRKLHSREKNFSGNKNRTVREAAAFLLESFPKLFLPADLPKRIIHTDPKISNFIFDNRGNAVTMIDWDTAQRLSPLYDLGDAIRSFCGEEEDDPHNKFNLANYKEFLVGYFSGSVSYLSAKERRLIPRAAGLVILGLAARFLNDYVDNSYFGWDPKRHRSRKEHNLARVLGQIALYKDFANKIGQLPKRP